MINHNLAYVTLGIFSIIIAGQFSDGIGAILFLLGMMFEKLTGGLR